MGSRPHLSSELRCRCRRPVSWNLWHSLWMLPALLGLGMVSWVSFGYIAARARKLSFALLTVVFFVGSVIGFMWNSNQQPGSTASGGFLFLLWAAGILAALAVNPTYLRARWFDTDRCRCGAHGAGRAPFVSHHPDPSTTARWAPSQAAPPAAMHVLQDILPRERQDPHPATPDLPRPAEPEWRPQPHTEQRPAVDGFASPGETSRQPDPHPSTRWPSAPISAGSSSSASPEDEPADHPDPPAAVRTSLGEAVVRSSTYARQKQVVRTVLDDDTLRRVIDHMSSAPGGRLSDAEMAEVLGVPLSRVAGGASCLIRQVNVDGYGVVRREDACTVLDAALLREQFRV